MYPYISTVSIHLSVYLPNYPFNLSICPSVCLSVCLYVCMSVCLSVYLCFYVSIETKQRSCMKFIIPDEANAATTALEVVASALVSSIFVGVFLSWGPWWSFEQGWALFFQRRLSERLDCGSCLYHWHKVATDPTRNYSQWQEQAPRHPHDSLQEEPAPKKGVSIYTPSSSRLPLKQQEAPNS